MQNRNLCQSKNMGSVTYKRLHPKKSPPHKWNGKVKPSRYVQKKYNLSYYKHLQLYDNESHCP